jgi:hypothetical protein
MVVMRGTQADPDSVVRVAVKAIGRHFLTPLDDAKR